MRKRQRGHVPTFYVSLRPEGKHRVRTLHVAMRKRIEVRRGRTGAAKSIHFFGIDSHFEKLPKSDAALRIVWLEHKDEHGRWRACSPDIDAGDQYSAMARGLEVLTAIGSMVERRMGHHNRPPSDTTFSDPSLVLHALRHSRDFVEIEPFRLDERIYWIQTAEMAAREVA